MTCTHQETKTFMGSKEGTAVFNGQGLTAIVHSAHRGGCLFCGSIFLRNNKTGKTKRMSSTEPTGCYAEVGETSAYLLALAKRHVA